MISSIISRLVIMVFGTLFPAYASYKAVKTKDFKEYVKWMMYWIVFALFTVTETITDVFLSWFPFYYEIKIILVIWLLSPATKGSSILYRKFVHPMLSSREQEIDDYISKAKEQSYKQVLEIGSKGMSALMQTALKNLNPTSLLQPPSSDSNLALENKRNKDETDSNKSSEDVTTMEYGSDDDISGDLPRDSGEKKSKEKIREKSDKKGKKKAPKPVRRSNRITNKTEYNEYSDE